MTTDLATPIIAPRIPALAGKYLTFTLHDESYGIEVLKVREIIRHSTITAVPQMPPYIRGVINLRGKIIPVMDLRRRFEFAEATDSGQTCIVVVQVTLADGKATPMGLVVDGVEEVINLSAADIEATPVFGGQICTDYILGMAKVKGAVKALLDIDRVVGADTLEKIRIPMA
jgi:purine-binding chemotaxis protein CheW